MQSSRCIYCTAHTRTNGSPASRRRGFRFGGGLWRLRRWTRWQLLLILRGAIRIDLRELRGELRDARVGCALLHQVDSVSLRDGRHHEQLLGGGIVGLLRFARGLTMFAQRNQTLLGALELKLLTNDFCLRVQQLHITAVQMQNQSYNVLWFNIKNEIYFIHKHTLK